MENNLMTLKVRLQELVGRANAVTGNVDINVSSAIDSLIAGYGMKTEEGNKIDFTSGTIVTSGKSEYLAHYSGYRKYFILAVGENIDVSAFTSQHAINCVSFVNLDGHSFNNEINTICWSQRSDASGSRSFTGTTNGKSTTERAYMSPNSLAANSKYNWICINLENVVVE